MKNKINWAILLWAGFIILVISDWKNIKYLFNLIKELNKMFKKHSEYDEDSGFVLIHKSQLKNL
jgi:hypothetical protein